MFDLDSPITLAGGNGGLPPITTKPRFAPASGDNNGPAKSSKPAPDNQTSTITESRYPKPRAWVEKRIALCESHHVRFIRWRKANVAKLQAWVQSQPGYDPHLAAQQAYESKLRRAFKRSRNA